MATRGLLEKQDETKTVKGYNKQAISVLSVRVVLVTAYMKYEILVVLLVALTRSWISCMLLINKSLPLWSAAWFLFVI